MTPASPSLAPSTPQPTGHWLWGALTQGQPPSWGNLLGSATGVVVIKDVRGGFLRMSCSWSLTPIPGVLRPRHKYLDACPFLPGA